MGHVSSLLRSSLKTVYHVTCLTSTAINPLSQLEPFSAFPLNTDYGERTETTVRAPKIDKGM